MKNTVNLIGRIGGSIDSFSAGANFSLATNEKYKNKEGELVEETQWHRCVIFGKQAETLRNHSTKGDLLAVDGRIKYREHEGKYYTDIIVDRFYFIQSKQSTAPVTNEGDKNDLPF